MTLTETLQEKLNAINEQLLKTVDTGNIEYLIRQRFYFRDLLRELESEPPEQKEYKPGIFRTSAAGTLLPVQSLTISNVGDQDGTITVDGSTTVLKRGESPSWAPLGNSYLSAIGYDATGTEFVITYLSI
jgi:hypothetical protein